MITCLARRIERKFFIIYSLFCLQRNNESIFIHFRLKKKFQSWIFNFSFELNVFKFDRNWWIDKKYFLFLKYFYFHFVTIMFHRVLRNSSVPMYIVRIKRRVYGIDFSQQLPDIFQILWCYNKMKLGVAWVSSAWLGFI